MERARPDTNASFAIETTQGPLYLTYDNCLVRRFPGGLIDHVEYTTGGVAAAAYGSPELLEQMENEGFRVLISNWIPDNEEALACRQFMDEIDRIVWDDEV